MANTLANHKRLKKNNPSCFLLFWILTATTLFSNEQELLHWKKVTQDQPQNANAWYNLGWYYQKMSFNKQAMIAYKKTIHIHPYHVNALINLGNIESKMRRHEKAQKYYKKSLKSNSKSTLALYNLGASYMKTQKFNLALNQFYKVIDLDQNHREAHLNIANIQLRFYQSKPNAQNLNKAKAHLVKAGKIDPTYPHVYYNLGIAYSYENSWGTALMYFRAAQKYYPPTSAYKRKVQNKISRITYLLSQ